MDTDFNFQLLAAPKSDAGGSEFQLFKKLTLPDFRRTLAAWQITVTTIGTPLCQQEETERTEINFLPMGMVLIPLPPLASVQSRLQCFGLQPCNFSL